MSIRLNKKIARQILKAQLQDTSAASITSQSANIASVLRGLPEYQKALKIAFYLHMEENEIETDQMIAYAFIESMYKSSTRCH